MTTPEDVTLVRNAIHNPTEPRHFMRIVAAPGQQLASVGDQVVARSSAAVVVKEIGHDFYDPVVYFPRADVDMAALSAVDKTTHCPLKGDTEYFDVVVGEATVAEAAWSYVSMIDADGVDDLQGRIAFDASRITMTTDLD